MIRLTAPSLIPKQKLLEYAADMILGFSLDHLAGVPADLILEFGQLCVSREGDTAVAA